MNERLQSLARDVPLTVEMFYGPSREAHLRRELYQALGDGNNAEDLLADFLSLSPNHQRLILYLPFELMPTTQSGRYQDVFMAGWRNLLLEEDVRANFVDGDIKEYDLAWEQPEKVVVARYLVPVLVKKGLIDEREAQDLWLTPEPPPEPFFQTLEELHARYDYLEQHPMGVSLARLKWEREAKVQQLIGYDRLPNGVTLPQLDSLMPVDIGNLEAMDGEVRVLYGSRVKGYSNRDADVDIAKVQDAPLHVLVGGILFGERDEVKRVRREIMAEYGRRNNERELWRQMEREVICYRLMHKGYGRFFPRQNIPLVDKGELMDGNSWFWDPGFRKVATRLFVAKVGNRALTGEVNGR